MLAHRHSSLERLMFEITDYRCQHHPNPHPEERAARLEEWERAPCLLPILLGVFCASAQKRLDAALRAAPQAEGAWFIDRIPPIIFSGFSIESTAWRGNFFAAYKR